MSEPHPDDDFEPDDDEADHETICDECNGRGTTMEGFICDECDGTGYWNV